MNDNTSINSDDIVTLPKWAECPLCNTSRAVNHSQIEYGIVYECHNCGHDSFCLSDTVDIENVELGDTEVKILESIKDKPYPYFALAGVSPPTYEQKVAWHLTGSIYAEQHKTHYLKITPAGILFLFFLQKKGVR